MSSAHPRNSSFQSCCICLEDYVADAAPTDTTVTHCGHKFHHECFRLYLATAQVRQCPWCNAPVELEGVVTPAECRAFLNILVDQLHINIGMFQVGGDDAAAYVHRINALFDYAIGLGLDPHMVQRVRRTMHAQMPIY